MKKDNSLSSINAKNSMNPTNPKTPELIRTQILDLVKEYHTAKFAPKTFDPDKDLVHYAGRVFDAEEIVNLVDASLDRKLAEERHCTGNDQSRCVGVDCVTL
jgi:hypothetical protein